MPRRSDRIAAARIADRHGIPRNIFLNLVRFESGWDATAKSPAGALGYTQLMPATARGLGVDAHDPLQNLEGGARYLKQQYETFGNWRLALAAYNAGPGAVQKYGGIPPYAETQRYVRNILAAAASSGGGVDRASQAKAGRAPSGNADANVASAAPTPDLAAPAFESLSHVGRDYSAVASLSALTNAVAATPPAAAPAAAPATSARKAARSSAGPGDVDHWIRLAPNADRSGAATKAGTLAFAAKVAHLYGRPLTVGTGTNHNEFVAGTTRVSEHWHGDAVDIPARGLQLIRIGRAALIAAGADPRWARKQRGGLFNVNGYQIIFNTSGPDVGGDHTDHAHLGVGHAKRKTA